MDIEFKSEKLKKICSESKKTVQAHGSEGAKKIHQRLFELRAAANLAEMSHLPPPRCHELLGNLKGVYSVDLVHPYRLLFIPNHTPVPMLENGGINKEAVTSILILRIENTHE